MHSERFNVEPSSSAADFVANLVTRPAIGRMSPERAILAMYDITTTTSGHSDPRRGMATLEFVLALPVLLTLMVAMTWLGFAVIGQTEVTVRARNQAWKRRFEDAGKQPLLFPTARVPGVAEYPEAQDYVTEKASTQVNVSPAFNRLPSPESTHTVIAGSWDHRAMPMNEPPSWKLHMVAVANAKTAGFQTTIGNLENLVDNLQDSAASVLAEQLGLGNLLDGLGNGIESGGGAAKDETERQRQAEKQRLTERRSDLVTQISQTDKEINELRIAYAKKLAENDPDKSKEEKQVELDRISQNIDLLKGKRQRLESELDDVQTELDALE
jgi:hypothetical protein